jgi:hypothetical protein
MYIYVYIYIERERETEREMAHGKEMKNNCKMLKDNLNLSCIILATSINNTQT